MKNILHRSRWCTVVSTGLLTAGILMTLIPPMRLTAATTEEELSILKAENARLRSEIELLRAKAQNEPEVYLESQRAHLTEMLRQFKEEHPKVKQQRAYIAQLEAVKKELEAKQKELEGLSRRYKAKHPAMIEQQETIEPLKARFRGQAPVIAGNGNEREKELLQKEIELADRELANLVKAREAGRSTSADVLRVQRELLALKRESAGSNNDTNKIQALLREEIEKVQEEIKAQKKLVELGRLPVETGLSLERELLRLQRELARIEK